MSLTLLDWRRRVAALYAAVRAETDAAAGHELWRAGRDGLLAHHPQSPLPRPPPLQSARPSYPAASLRTHRFRQKEGRRKRGLA